MPTVLVLVDMGGCESDFSGGDDWIQKEMDILESNRESTFTASSSQKTALEIKRGLKKADENLYFVRWQYSPDCLSSP